LGIAGIGLRGMRFHALKTTSETAQCLHGTRLSFSLRKKEKKKRKDGVPLKLHLKEKGSFSFTFVYNYKKIYITRCLRPGQNVTKTDQTR